MLRFGIRAHDMPEANFEDLVQSISKAGFTCTQLALKKAVRDYNIDIDAMTPGLALYMKEVFQKNKLEVAILGSYFNLTTPDPAQEKEIMKMYEAHIRFASLLGCGMVGTETGAVNATYAYEEANHSKEALNCLIERLKHIMEYAEKMGVLFGVEPVYKHIMWNVESTRIVLDKVNSPNLRVILDPVNLLSVDNHINQDDIMKEAFQVIKNEIDCIHIKDFFVEGNSIMSRPVTLGEGMLNIPLLLSLVKKHKPGIHILLEDSMPTNVQQSRKYIEEQYSRTI